MKTMTEMNKIIKFLKDLAYEEVFMCNEEYEYGVPPEKTCELKERVQEKANEYLKDKSPENILSKIEKTTNKKERVENSWWLDYLYKAIKK